MSERPIIIVAGFPRCGSSLTMQMLHACGIKCAGTFPAFEPVECQPTNGALTKEWMEQFEAVKILDPHRFEIPPVNAKVIWLDRNPVYQSVSIVKFGMYVAGMPYDNTVAGKIVRSMREEFPQVLAKFDGLPMVRLHFEDLICAPRVYCYDIAKFIAPEYAGRLDIQKMMQCVRLRANGFITEPSLNIETELCAIAGEMRVP